VTCTALDQCHIAGTCDSGTGACSNPPQVDGFACDDGDNCTASDMCQAGACAAGAPSCSGPFALTSTASGVQALHVVTATLAADHTDVAPGDQIGVTATLTNAGFSFGISGTLEAENTSAEPVVLGSIEVRLEYFSAAQGQWVLLSTAGRNESNAPLPSNPPSSYFSAFASLFGPGVSYPMFTVAGTTIAPGSTAGWAYNAGTFIAPEVGLAAVVAARTSPVRFVLRVGTSPESATVDSVVDLTQTFAGLPEIPLAASSVSARLDDGAPVILSPAAPITATQVSAAYTGTVSRPAAPPRSGFASDGAYLQMLAVEVGKSPTIFLISSFTSAPNLVLPGAVPLLRTGVVNPPSIVAGQPVHYGLQFRNDGSGLASAISVAHVLGGNPLGTVDAPSQLAAAASTTGSVDFTAPGSPPLADQVVVTWSDRNANVYGPLTYTPSSCPTETCASLGVAQSLGQLQAERQVTMTLAHAPGSVVPGDPVTFTSEVSNTGAAFTIANGTVTLGNLGFSPFVIQGYQQTLEYYSPVDDEWIPFARRAVDATGVVLPESTLLSINVSFSEPVVAPGVTYSQQPIVGTLVEPGSVARWSTFYTYPTVVIPSAILGILLDPSQAAGHRSVIRFDVTEGPAPEPAVVDISPTFSAYTSEVPDLAVRLWFANSATPVPLTPAGSGPLAPGETRSLSGTASVPFIGATTFQSVGAEAIDPNLPNTSLASASTVVGLDIPILLAQKTGPAQSSAGLTETYSVVLNNVGTAAAETVAVADSVDGAPVVGAVITAPSTVAAGGTATATIAAPSPLERPAGPMTDVAMVTYRDRNGNVYPPQEASFTTELGPAHLEGYLSFEGDVDVPGLVGSPKTITVKALDPQGQPAPGVSVHFVVTGINPQTADLATGVDGKAHLTYSGVAIGKDRIVASATITTTPITLSSIEIDWVSAVGTPCTGRATPLDIMVMLDVSGSMIWELPSLTIIEGKLQGARDATHRFIDNLSYARDRIGALTFFGGVVTFSELSTDTVTAKQRITDGVDAAMDCISGLFCNLPGGGNDGLGTALNAAIDELESPRHRADATKVLVYVGDGGTIGDDPSAAIARLHSSGIQAVGIAIGANNEGPELFGTRITSAEIVRSIASTPNDYFYAPSTGDIDWVYNHLNQDICRNRQPLVKAGGDQGFYSVRLPDLLPLNGEVHEDGAAGDPRFTSEWSVVSGPGEVTFVDATSPVTKALFALPGTYVLQLAATDGYLNVADRATITVDPEPSLAGASLVVALGVPGPLTLGATETLTATLTNAVGAPIANFPIEITVAGANPTSAVAITNAAGSVSHSYVGTRPGTDLLHATALGNPTPIDSATVSVIWNEPATGSPVLTQGWIASPLHQARINEPIPIVLASDVTLVSGTLSYWPATTPSDVRVLATGLSGAPGATLTTFDPTVLANGSYIVDLTGTNDGGTEKSSEIFVTVSGDYKPGRLVVEVTDFTVPIAGLPITVGRRYDSLEKDKVGDFGYGWSLAIGNPRLEVDQAHSVTITLPEGRRSTFYLAPTSYPFPFRFLYPPTFVAEPGTFGKLTSDGCDPIMYVGSGPICFLDGGLTFAPTEYTYTDPYGRQFVMAASGKLKSIRDHQGNRLTFAPNGILSSTGVSVTFERDSEGRITRALSPLFGPIEGFQSQFEYTYTYDANGDLEAATRPPVEGNAAVTHYTYAAHRLETTVDPRGNPPARTSTYTTDGRLETDTDGANNVTSYAYNLATRTTVITNPDGGQVTQVFDARGLLVSETNPLGYTTTHEYDANRNEVRMVNALNEETTATYDPVTGYQLSKTTPLGTTHTTYGPIGNPTSFTNELGHVTTIEYDDRYLPKRIADALGTRATFRSSEQGLPITIDDAEGKQVHLTYDAAGNRTSITDRLGRVTRTTYDQLGRELTRTSARGGVTKTEYTTDGMMPARLIDAMGGVARQEYDVNRNKRLNVTPDDMFETFTYDALNRVQQMVEHGGGLTIDYTHDFRGNLLTQVDSASRTTTHEYDLAGQLEKTTFPDGTFTERTYDPLGRLTTLKDERGNTTSYEYQSGCGCSERMTKVTDPLGRVTETTYDAIGRRTSVKDANNHTTSFVYDVRGHLTDTQFHDGTSIHDVYDPRGRRISSRDQMLKTTLYGYDDAGQLTSVTDPLGNVTTCAYDLDGNLTSVTDGNEHTTTYEYDLLARKTKRTLPLGMYETFTYNAGGLELTHVDFRGKTTTNVYGTRRRLASRTPDASLSEPAITFTYNATGTRATMTDASGTTSYTYDARDRVLTKAAPAGKLTYTYDATGNLATIRSSNQDGTPRANGTSVDYAWDAANQFVSVTDNRVGGVTTAAYTPTGRPNALSQPNGVSLAYSYDTLDRVTSLAWQRSPAPPFASWAYTHNGRGQRLTATDVTGRAAAYGYDDDGWLTSETISGASGGAGNNGAITYVLDGVGNRVSRTSAIAAIPSASYSYDANDQLTSDDYDLNGNTTNSGGDTFGYDFENRLVSKNGGAVSIVYDGDGNRVAKTAGGVTTNYLVDDLNPTGFLQVMEEVVGSTVQTRYTFGSSLVSQTRNVSSTPVTSYYGYDAHGNVTFLTDATGAVTGSYDYDAWGNIVAQTGSTPNTRLYTGEEFDPDLGLVNLRARSYRPSAGRFMTIDPAMGNLLRPLSLNRYLYVEADPVDLTDPKGRSTAIPWGGIVAGISGALIREAAVTVAQGVAGGVLAVVAKKTACAMIQGTVFTLAQAALLPSIVQDCAKTCREIAEEAFRWCIRYHQDPPFCNDLANDIFEECEMGRIWPDEKKKPPSLPN
jgi:RHS repeat-associated protein